MRPQFICHPGPYLPRVVIVLSLANPHVDSYTQWIAFSFGYVSCVPGALGMATNEFLQVVGQPSRRADAVGMVACPRRATNGRVSASKEPLLIPCS